MRSTIDIVVDIIIATIDLTDMCVPIGTIEILETHIMRDTQKWKMNHQNVSIQRNWAKSLVLYHHQMLLMNMHMARDYYPEKEKLWQHTLNRVNVYQEGEKLGLMPKRLRRSRGPDLS